MGFKSYIKDLRDSFFGTRVQRYEKKIKRIQDKLNKMCIRAGVSLVATKMPSGNSNSVNLSFVPTEMLDDRNTQEKEMFDDKLRDLQKLSPRELLRRVPKKFRNEMRNIIREKGHKINKYE